MKLPRRTTSLKRTKLAASFALLGVTGGLLAACGSGAGAGSSDGDIVVGGLWPLSGQYAYSGKAVLAGAEAAVEDINAAGGIKALDGRKIRLESADAGTSAQTATAAANRLLSSGDVSAVAGAWSSALTIAASEVTERRGVPMVSESFADDVTAREGFSHVFGYSPPSSQTATLMADAVVGSLESTGKKLETVAVVGDNSPGGTPLQEALIKDLEGRGVKVAAYEQWTPPLQDASGVAQKIASANADAVLLVAFSFNDVSSLVKQVRARGVTTPIIQSGGQGVLPQWLQVGDSIEGMSSFVYTNPLSKDPELTASIAESTGDDYVWQDQIGGYIAVTLIADALEAAGDSDPEAVTKALAGLKLDSGAVVDLLPMDEFSFDDNGRVKARGSVLAQWQKVDGKLVPCTVFPVDVAECKGQW